jgi:hypothetical protein
MAKIILSFVASCIAVSATTDVPRFPGTTSGPIRLKVAPSAQVGLDSSTASKLRSEVRSAMWNEVSQFLGSAAGRHSFLGNPRVDPNDIKNGLFVTQQLRNPAARVNVIEQEPDSAHGHQLNETRSGAQKLYNNFRSNLLKLRTGSSFLQARQAPYQEINVAMERRVPGGARGNANAARSAHESLGALAEESASASAAIASALR